MKNLMYWLLPISLGISSTAHAGLVALFQFNDSAQLVQDSSGNGVTATNVNATYDAAGYQGGALSLNGVDQFVRVNLDVRQTTIPQMTWGAWVQLTDNTPIRQVLSNDNMNFDRSIGIDFRGGTSGQFSAFTGAGVLGNGGVAPLNQWTFIAATYDNTINSMSFWVDGTKLTTSTNYDAAWDFFDIGHNPSFGEFFAGKIDNVFVYDEALTDAQISALRLNGFNAAAVPEPESLVLLLAGVGFVSAAVRRKQA